MGAGEGVRMETLEENELGVSALRKLSQCLGRYDIGQTENTGQHRPGLKLAPVPGDLGKQVDLSSLRGPPLTWKEMG